MHAEIPWLSGVTKEQIAAEMLRRGIVAGECLWPAPYNLDTPKSAYRFITERCYTYNDADSAVELIPSKRYVRRLVFEWWKCRRRGRTLIIEKSRRLIASWILRGLQLWAMGIKRTKAVIVGLTYGKAAEHVWRIWHMWDELSKPHPGNPTAWTLAPAKHLGGDPRGFVLDQVILPNGSTITKINQESDTFQGSGYAMVDLEEFSLYNYPSGIYSQALFVTQGKPKTESAPEFVGGFCVIVTNPSSNKQWKDQKCKIVARQALGMDPSDDKECLVMPGMAACNLANGSRYLAVHLSADEDKTPAWVAVEKPKFGEREWNNQMDLDEEIRQGEPVFADYSHKFHCPTSIRSTGIPCIPRSVYVAGWDVDLRPAFVLIQISPGKQRQVLLEVTSEGGEPMPTFMPRVLYELQRKLPGRWASVYHGADATCVNRTAATGASVSSELRKMGIALHPMSNIISVRYAAVQRGLIERVDVDGPAMIIDPLGCPVLLEGFSGEYKYQDNAKGDTIGNANVIRVPLKNGYAAPQDALQYACQCANRYLDGKLKLPTM